MKEHKFPSCRCGKEFPKRLLSAFEADFSSRSAIWQNGTLVPQGMMPAFFEVLDVATLFQHNELLSKYRPESKDSREILARRAIDKFLLVEDRLRVVNSRLVSFPSSFRTSDDDSSDYSFYLSRAEKLIMNLIGYWLPDQKQLFHTARFGPGSTLDGTRATKDVYFKLRRWPYAYPRASRGPVCDAIYDDQRWFGTLVDEIRNLADDQFSPLLMERVWTKVLHPVVANRVTTVPKNSEIDRTIAIEPLMGIYLQLGVDGFIRQRLKTVGIDLDDQELNASAAKAASLDDDLATLDLSSASDSVSTELVRDLMPRPWFDYLNSLRAPYGILPDGRVVKYEKFSSMGNGFTFALESLIFWALARSVVPDSEKSSVYIYGDDIIVPSYYAETLKGLLTYVGFEMNQKKSFVSGPFRESCGMNAWNGACINPVRLKEMPQTVEDLAILYDQFFLWYNNNVPDRRFCDSFVAREILSHMPTGAVRYGPACLTHVGHWLFRDEFVQVGRLHHIEGYRSHGNNTKPTNFMWGRLKAPLRKTPLPSSPFEKVSQAGLFEIPDISQDIDIYSHHYEYFATGPDVPIKWRL